MPEPVLLSIATAVVTRAVTGLYELVKSKFANDPVATSVFEAAEAAGPGSPEVTELSETLERAERADPEFGRRLRGEWEKTAVTQTGHVTNQISGTVHGKVLQAGDIQGGVTF